MTSAEPPPLNPEHWQRVKELLNSALDLPAEDRQRFLEEQCGSDTALMTEVQSLLSSYDEAGDEFMDAHRDEPPAAALKPHDPFVGLRIGPYRVIEEIGHGGMGTVFRAVRADDHYRKQVAIKVVRRGMDHDFVLRRFRNERQILATLEHNNIARLLDGGATEDGQPYFVMEYVQRGEPIDSYCDSRELDTRGRLNLFIQVCDAVQAAHDRKIIHRDIKPSNILVNAQGLPKLLDFGIAKILDPEISTQTIEPTATILRLMTPEYASPEQVRGELVTEASDVYSLGVLLYELLTGHRPYQLKSRSPHEIAQVICEAEPERPSTAVGRIEQITRGGEPPITVTPEVVSKARHSQPSELRRALSGDLDNIVLMAIRKDPQQRYDSAAALASDLRRHLDGLSVSARKTTALHRVWKNVYRNRSIFAIALIVVLTCTVLVMVWRLVTAPPAHLEFHSFTPLTSLPGDESQPAVSPDGRHVAYMWGGRNNENTDIYIRDVQSGAVEQITATPVDEMSPAWSPDGARLAFLQAGETQTSVQITSVPRGTSSQIAGLSPSLVEGVGRHLDWSPDGRTLLVTDRSVPDAPFRLVSIDVRSGRKVNLTQPPPATLGDRNGVFSPDGKTIAFIRAISSGVDDVYTVPLSGGTPKRITTDQHYIISVGWTRDANTLLFSSNRGGSQLLWHVPAAGGDARRLALRGDNTTDSSFSPDGKWMAYTAFHLDTNIWGGRPGQPLRRVIASSQYDSSPQLSPDGQRIAFRSLRSGSNEVWIANADGSGERQLTNFRNTLTGTPRWSPDGRTIACDSRPQGKPDIFLVDVESGKSRQITMDPAEDVVPSFSRDGKFVYFASHRQGVWQVWKKAIAGGEAVQITRGGGFAAFESFDGKEVYYAKGRGTVGIWKTGVNGGEERVVTDQLAAGYWGYWGLCNEGLVYLNRETGRTRPEFLLLRPGSQKPTSMGFVDKPVQIADSGFAITPDCKTYYVTQTDQSGSDLMRADIAPPR